MPVKQSFLGLSAPPQYSKAYPQHSFSREVITEEEKCLNLSKRACSMVRMWLCCCGLRGCVYRVSQCVQSSTGLPGTVNEKDSYTISNTSPVRNKPFTSLLPVNTEKRKYESMLKSGMVLGRGRKSRGSNFMRLGY